jgi:hypothetical protein
MVRHYIEMTYFDASKETDNKLRWDTTVDGVVDLATRGTFHS